MRNIGAETVTVPLPHGDGDGDGDGDVDVDGNGNGDEMDAHFLAPVKSPSRIPAVIVVHDILGLNDDTRRICQRLANGPKPLAVIAPDLYQGLGPKPVCVVKTLRSLKRGSGTPFERLAAVQTWLGSVPFVDPARIAVVGFCMGGGFAVLHAARAKVSVVAPFYGDVPRDLEDLNGICPVVGGYGEKDSVFVSQGHRLVNHLDTLQVEHDLKFYPGVGHSYMNQLSGVAKLGRWTPLRAAYDEAAAEDSWRRVFEFFDQHL
ncbi:MAG: dienelactone hydrolase family protein [Pseudomonadales bacterium]|nr:dienelactone hydrolase family protein [Pseudomonadales bacterium]